MALSKETVLELQTKLNEYGYACAVNGVLTGNTKLAYKKYCESAGIQSINLQQASSLDVSLLAISNNRIVV